MRIANETIDVAEAVDRVRIYADKHPRTLEIFDGLGSAHRDMNPDRITLADIGRLVVINGRPDADDVPALLDANASLLATLPADAALESCEVGDETWNLAADLYESFRIVNIGRAKRSKLLHAKRPRMFFINDSVTSGRYEQRAAKVADSDGPIGGGYWAAAREDIRQEEFVELMSSVAKIEIDSPSGTLDLGSLSRLRVLDIVCWTP